jgi:hypothetical protein
MALPPTPAKQSMMTALSSGADFDMCCAILLHASSATRDTANIEDASPYHATGSGVTPNHASSVNQMPSSYFEKML